MKHKLFAWLFLIASLGFYACEQEDIMYYEGGNAVHFIKTSQEFSFLTQLDAESAILQVPVRLVGNVPEEAITFSVEVVNDAEYTTATADQYSILETVIPAGEVQGYISLEVKNPEKLNLDTKTLHLRLKLVSNEAIKAGGWMDYLVVDVLWSSDVVKPKTWGGMRWFLLNDYKEYSSNLYRAYIAATGCTEMYYSLGGLHDPELGRYWTQEECFVKAKQFGDWIRKWNEEHAPEVYCHDDGDFAGQPIVPQF